MRPPLQSLFLVTILSLLTLAEGRSQTVNKADEAFEITVRITPLPSGKQPDENKLAEDLRARAKKAKLTLRVNPGPADDGKVLIVLDGPNEAEIRKNLSPLLISTRLELRMVHPQSSTLAEEVNTGAKIVPGYEVCEYRTLDHEGNVYTERFLLSKSSSITGEDIKNAWPDAQQSDKINVVLTEAGGKRMIALTKNMAKGRDRLAIVLNGKVKSAPVVNDVIAQQFVITGIDGPEGAETLCAALLAPLSAELKIESVRPLKPAP